MKPHAFGRKPSRARGDTKLVFMLATSVAFGTVTHVAHASCGGSGCNSFSVEGRNYNYTISEKRLKAAFINKAKSDFFKSISARLAFEKLGDNGGFLTGYRGFRPGNGR